MRFPLIAFHGGNSSEIAVQVQVSTSGPRFDDALAIRPTRLLQLPYNRPLCLQDMLVNSQTVEFTKLLY